MSLADGSLSTGGIIVDLVVALPGSAEDLCSLPAVQMLGTRKLARACRTSKLDWERGEVVSASELLPLTVPPEEAGASTPPGDALPLVVLLSHAEPHVRLQAGRALAAGVSRLGPALAACASGVPFGLDDAAVSCLGIYAAALAAWHKDYNIERPHSRLGWQTPAGFAQTFTPQRG